jgi:hypothetical protein
LPTYPSSAARISAAIGGGAPATSIRSSANKEVVRAAM